jgi:hypothetical protein
MLKSLSLSSDSKPFITDNIVISEATPRVIPINETIEINEANPLLFFELK